MKYKVWSMILLAALLMMLVSCGEAAIPAGDVTVQTDDVTVPTDNVTAQTDMRCLTERSAQNHIVADIPYFGAEQEALNDMVENYVRELLINYIPDARMDVSDTCEDVVFDGDYTGYAVDVDCRITYRSDTLISMVFEGMLNMKDSAHPTHLFFTFNVNPQTAERVLLEERYVVDEALYAAFIRHVSDSAEGAMLAESVDLEELWPIEEFLSGWETEAVYCAYFTDTTVGISAPVAHAVGDHLEAEIPLDELTAVIPRG